MKPAWYRRNFNAALAALALHLGAGMSRSLSPAWAQDSALPIPDSLPDVAAAAERQGEPLVLLISLRGCPYCELVRRNYLLPARANGLPVWPSAVRVIMPIIKPPVAPIPNACKAG